MQAHRAKTKSSVIPWAYKDRYLHMHTILFSNNALSGTTPDPITQHDRCGERNGRVPLGRDIRQPDHLPGAGYSGARDR